MPDGIKDYKRLAAAAYLHNNNGFVNLTFVNHDGGHFELPPKITNNAIVLADPDQPRYALQIDGDPEVLKRVANALNTLARNIENDSTDTVE